MWKWIKIPKGVALLAFFLPWMTVSCSGTPIVKGNGFQLAFGQLSTMGPASGESGNMNVWLIIALLAIVGGLALAVLRDRGSAKFSLGSSALALVLVLIGTMQYSKSAILARAPKKTADASNPFSSDSMDQAAAGMIQIDWHFGYYLVLLSLIVACVMAFLVMTNRDQEASDKLSALANDAQEAVTAAASQVSAAVNANGGTCPKCGKTVKVGVKFCPDDGTAIEAPPAA